MRTAIAASDRRAQGVIKHDPHAKVCNTQYDESDTYPQPYLDTSSSCAAPDDVTEIKGYTDSNTAQNTRTG
jgi:hypothetical protein